MNRLGIIFMLFLFNLTYGEILQNLIKTTMAEDVLITKTCVVESYDIINPNTGAKSTNYQTLLNIKIKNTRTIKQKLILEQDNSFIPNTIEVKFNLKPISAEGNYYKWDLGMLDVDQEKEIVISLKTQIDCERFLRDYGTVVNYTRPYTKLFTIEGEKTATKGERVSLYIKNLEGQPAINVAVVIKKPSGAKVQYYTTKEGKLEFLADEEGTYFVESIGTQIGLEELVRVYALNKTNETITNHSSQTKKPQESGFSADYYSIAGLFIIILMIAGAYFVYKKMFEKKEYEEVYIPPAAAPTSTSDLQYKNELEAETEEKIKNIEKTQENEIEQNEEESDEILSLTSSLVEKRRKLLNQKQKIEEFVKKELQTEIGEEEKQQLQQREEMGEMEIEEEEFEDEEIDEEAIKKTIEELEQLRQELKRRQYEQNMPPESAINYDETSQQKIEKMEEGAISKKIEKKEKAKKTKKEPKESSEYEGEIEDIEKTLESLVGQKKEQKSDKKTKRGKKPKAKK
ncbi:MAG: hypothetical protein QXV83_04105 [Candidatus Anstonellaceae archaeon]